MVTCNKIGYFKLWREFKKLITPGEDHPGLPHFFKNDILGLLLKFIHTQIKCFFHLLESKKDLEIFIGGLKVLGVPTFFKTEVC